MQCIIKECDRGDYLIKGQAWAAGSEGKWSVMVRRPDKKCP